MYNNRDKKKNYSSDILYIKREFGIYRVHYSLHLPHTHTHTCNLLYTPEKLWSLLLVSRITTRARWIIAYQVSEWDLAVAYSCTKVRESCVDIYGVYYVCVFYTCLDDGQPVVLCGVRSPQSLRAWVWYTLQIFFFYELLKV